MNNIVVKGIAGALLVGGLSFWGGISYQADKAPVRGAGNFTQGAGGLTRGGDGTGMGGAVTGSIIAKDAISITVSLRPSGSKIIFYDTTTEVGKTVTGSASDLVIGKNVVVTGKANTDGSVTAQMIQLRPAFASSTPDRAGDF